MTDAERKEIAIIVRAVLREEVASWLGQGQEEHAKDDPEPAPAREPKRPRLDVWQDRAFHVMVALLELEQEGGRGTAREIVRRTKSNWARIRPTLDDLRDLGWAQCDEGIWSATVEGGNGWRRGDWKTISPLAG